MLCAPIILDAKEVLQAQGLCFIENKGQITDQYHQSRSDIDAKLVAGKGLNIFIGKHGLHYQYASPLDSTHTAMQRMDVALLNSNADAKLIKEEAQYYFETYYTPPFCADHGAKAHSFKRLTYQNIYPNIDWTLYIKDNKLEYDFIVHPGGHVKDIQMQYGGADSVSLLAAGVLRATTAQGSLEEMKPLAFELESSHTRDVAFQLKNNTLSFEVEPYEGTIIIDPSIVWVTYYGGSNLDEISSSATDNTNNLLIAGMTKSYTNIASTAAYQTTLLDTNGTLFLAQIDFNGNRLWGSYITSVANWRTALLCDTVGNIYLSGATAIGFATSYAYQPALAGQIDLFLAKFSNSGSLIWSTNYGGTATENSPGLAYDTAGYIYISGTTYSTSNIASSNAYLTSRPSNFAACFLAKFTSTGNRVWGTYFGGDSTTYNNPENVTTDKFGNIYLSGRTNSNTGIATIGAYATSLYSGVPNSFLAKFNAAGSLQWATYVPQTAYSISCDWVGNVYIVGSQDANGNFATSGVFQTSRGGGSSDAYLAKYNSSGILKWLTNYGGNDVDIPYYVSCDNRCNIFITGNTGSMNNMASANAIQTTRGGMLTIFWAEFDSTGNRKYGTYFGTQYGSIGMCILPQHRYIYLTGDADGAIWPGTAGTQQPNFNGITDGLVAKFYYDTLVYFDTGINNMILCSGASFNVSYYVSDSFRANNTFIVQLSDSAGNFTNAINIGSNATNISGNINCSLPINTVQGNNYKMRIIGNSPADTSYTVSIKIRKLYPLQNITYNSLVCLHDTLHFTASDSNQAISYSWIGPNNFYDTTKNFNLPISSYNDSGNYIIHLINSPCSLYDTFHLAIKPMPVITNAWSNSPVCAGDTLKFTSAILPANALYVWSGPNNFSASVANPTKLNATFNDSGNYILSAYLNGCYSVADTLVMHVNSTPSQPLINSNSPVCEGDTLQLNGQCNTAGISYHWVGPNAFTSALQNLSLPNAASNLSGNYALTVSLGNCSAAAVMNVIVKPLPNHPSLSSNSAVCAGDSLKLNITSNTIGASYLSTGPNNWSNSNSSGFAIAQAVLADSGMYHIVCSKNGCSVVDSLVLSVKPLPQAPQISSNSPLCAGDTLLLQASSNGNSYQWNGPNGFMHVGSNVGLLNVGIFNSGYYKIRVGLNSCYKIDSVWVQVSNLPGLPVINSNSIVCEGDTLRLQVSNSQTANSYVWSGPMGFSGNQAQVNRPASVIGYSGLYKVIVDSNNCKDSAGLQVTVHTLLPAPTVQISVSPSDTVCAGTNLLFNAIGSNWYNANFYWYDNGNLFGPNSNGFTTANIANGDQITCKVRSFGICQPIDSVMSNVIKMTVIYNAPPQVYLTQYPSTFTPGTTVTFTGHPSYTNGLTYVWKVNGNIQSSTANFFSSNTISMGDSVCLITYSHINCTLPDSVRTCVQIGESIGGMSMRSILVYPNPVENELVIEGAEKASIKIYDVLGRKIYSNSDSSNKESINTTNWLPGAYWVELDFEDGKREVSKVVK